ncbi:uroporphyrinogen-III synthase [Jeotgalibacillus proteolyticus]|uniref:Uroporphyrinogen-III synthase n=1 Tax=Jeotgalibacillus proteolyticus TaxID=2082395 RepID=A0A2S5GF41_9BACL|nr:uroporphyrinogen-III synthase [Jeotgalibacillus proteolyticus]PPA71558.1 hypothetical protein C4B60_05720 [Jeotgalibacillus proteolyticus]
MSYSLNNHSILITRPYEAACKDKELIESYKGKALLIPMIETHPIKSYNEVDILSSLSMYNWIVFTSRRGVSYTLKLLKDKGLLWNLHKMKIAVIGKKTANLIEEEGFTVSFCPESFRAADFIKEFPFKKIRGERILFPQGNLARDLLVKAFSAHGAECDKWVIYKTFNPDQSKERLLQAFERNEFDIAVFASPSAVRNFNEIARGNPEVYQHLLDGKWPLASIGPTTTEELKRVGLRVDIEPQTYTMEEMLKEIISYIKHTGRGFK